MKKLRIFLYVDEVEWATADYIRYQEDSKSQSSVRVEGCTITNALSVKVGALLNFKLFYLNELVSDHELQLVREVNYVEHQTIELYTASIPRWVLNEQKVIDLFRLDARGKLPDWRTLTVKEKEAYQTLCLYASGIPTKPIRSDNYVLEGNRLNYAIDFYCLLGEAFFGRKGYFGRCEHSLNDCFSQLYSQHPQQPLVEPDTSFTIFQADQVEQVLNDVYPEHFSVVMAIFKRYGITVHLS